jgi:hypothetical protein
MRDSRSAAGVTISFPRVLQCRIVQHGVSLQPFQPRVLVLQRTQGIGAYAKAYPTFDRRAEELAIWLHR